MVAIGNYGIYSIGNSNLNLLGDYILLLFLNFRTHLCISVLVFSVKFNTNLEINTLLNYIYFIRFTLLIIIGDLMLFSLEVWNLIYIGELAIFQQID